MLHHILDTQQGKTIMTLSDHHGMQIIRDIIEKCLLQIIRDIIDKCLLQIVRDIIEKCLLQDVLTMFVVTIILFGD
jgi:DNA integrity scanning protein DisA with diadenylate cyclase activity